MSQNNLVGLLLQPVVHNGPVMRCFENNVTILTARVTDAPCVSG